MVSEVGICTVICVVIRVGPPVNVIVVGYGVYTTADDEDADAIVSTGM